MKAKVTSVSVDDLDRHRSLWEGLEARAVECSPFETYAWQRAWAAVHQPQDLRLLEVERRDGEIVGLAVIESDGGRRWRFAGGPRGMLCSHGAEQTAWGALFDWLQRNRDEWTTLEAVTAPEIGMRLRSAQVSEVTVPCVALPGTFDDYLAMRPRRIRKRVRQRMRKLERCGGEVRVVEASQRASALDDMVRMHGERAASKGEVHDGVDRRMALLLERVAAAAGGPDVRVSELVVEGERVGVNVRLDHRDTAYSYSDGISVERLNLSPGIVLDLESIRDAIGCGFGRYDLGPGDYDYKHDLGAVSGRRQLEAEIVSPTARGMLAKARLAATARVRSVGWAAKPARWLRDRARSRQAAMPVPLVEQLAYWSPLFPYGRTPGG